jgi:hypothetical protein
MEKIPFLRRILASALASALAVAGCAPFVGDKENGSASANSDTQYLAFSMRALQDVPADPVRAGITGVYFWEADVVGDTDGLLKAVARGWDLDGVVQYEIQLVLSAPADPARRGKMYITSKTRPSENEDGGLAPEVQAALAAELQALAAAAQEQDTLRSQGLRTNTLADATKNCAGSLAITGMLAAATGMGLGGSFVLCGPAEAASLGVATPLCLVVAVPTVGVADFTDEMARKTYQCVKDTLAR